MKQWIVRIFVGRSGGWHWAWFWVEIEGLSILVNVMFTVQSCDQPIISKGQLRQFLTKHIKQTVLYPLATMTCVWKTGWSHSLECLCRAFKTRLGKGKWPTVISIWEARWLNREENGTCTIQTIPWTPNTSMLVSHVSHKINHFFGKENIYSWFNTAWLHLQQITCLFLLYSERHSWPLATIIWFLVKNTCIYNYNYRIWKCNRHAKLWIFLHNICIIFFEEDKHLTLRKDKLLVIGFIQGLLSCSRYCKPSSACGSWGEERQSKIG